MRNSNVCHRPTNAAAREWLRIALLGGLWPLWAAGQEVSVDCLLGPDRVAEVGSPVTGVVEFVWVERGDRVSAGQKLATLKTDVEEASVSVARARAGSGAEVRTAQANHEFALQKLARAEDLERQGFVSQQALDQLRTEVKVAAQRLALAGDHQQVWRAEHELARRQLARRTIRAPFDGVVAERYVSAGERVEEKPAFRIIKTDPLRVEVVAPSSLFGSVRAGMTTQVSPDLPGSPTLTAVVVRVDKFIDASNNTFRLGANLPNPGNALPPGVRCKAKLAKSAPAGRS
ncbi:MAG: efflux RND transporter periplasmic adaptor subunit [Burkholderiales bacterium]